MRGKTDIKVGTKRGEMGEKRGSETYGLAAFRRVSLMEFSLGSGSNDTLIQMSRPRTARSPNRAADYVARFKLHRARDYAT